MLRRIVAPVVEKIGPSGTAALVTATVVAAGLWHGSRIAHRDEQQRQLNSPKEAEATQDNSSKLAP